MSDSERLLKAVEHAVAEATAGRSRVAVAYSGGLDSAMVALLAKRSAEVICYTACTRDSYDFRNIQSLANRDGFGVEIVELTWRSIQRLAGQAGEALDTDDPVRIGYSIPLLAVLDSALEDIVLAGNCADELFAGYAKYESAEDVEGMMRLDLEKALSELNRVKTYAKSVRKHLKAPFASDEVIRAASSIHISRKIGPAGRKLILREIALDLHAEGHDRPKRAAQYSSGVAKAMERMAKNGGMTQRAWGGAQRGCEPAQSSNR